MKLKTAILVATNKLLESFDYELGGNEEAIIAEYLTTKVFVGGLNIYANLYQLRHKDAGKEK